VKHVVAALSVALVTVLVGCGLERPPVILVTGIPPNLHHGDGVVHGCFTSWAEGPVIFDPTYGTAIIDLDLAANAPPDASPPAAVPVAWPPSYTARLHGSEVAVLDPQGNVVATTGHKYRIDGGYVGPAGLSGDHPLPMNRAFYACGSVKSIDG
jgi:hypothetical protein